MIRGKWERPSHKAGNCAFSSSKTETFQDSEMLGRCEHKKWSCFSKGDVIISRLSMSSVPPDKSKQTWKSQFLSKIKASQNKAQEYLQEYKDIHHLTDYLDVFIMYMVILPFKA